MRLHGIPTGEIISDCIINIGQELILNSRLSGIIDYCFKGISGEANARIVCEKLANKYLEFEIFSSSYQGVLASLSKTQPEIFLDEFLGKEQEDNSRLMEALSREGRVLSYINDEVIKQWCEINPKVRYPVIAHAIRPFRQVDKDGILEWTPLAMWIMDNYYDPIAILNIFKESFYPRTWWGSFADKLQSCLCLITSLKFHSNLVIAAWATDEEEKFTEDILLTRENELKRERQRDERFE